MVLETSKIIGHFANHFTLIVSMHLYSLVIIYAFTSPLYLSIIIGIAQAALVKIKLLPC